MLDIAKVTYLLSKGSSGGELYGRYGYLRSRFDRYKSRQVNAVCVLDEAHTIASNDDARDEDTVAAELARRSDTPASTTSGSSSRPRRSAPSHRTCSAACTPTSSASG